MRQLDLRAHMHPHTCGREFGFPDVWFKALFAFMKLGPGQEPGGTFKFEGGS